VTHQAWLVLDVDDTLVDTYRTGYAKCVAAAGALGLPPPSPDEFAELYGRMRFEQCVGHLHPDVDIARYQATYDAQSSRFPPRPRCNGSALLAAIERAGLRRGVLTNGPSHKTIAKLSACGLSTDDFEFVISGDTAAVPKPHVDAFSALTGYGVDPSTAWYVSDSAADWRAAESACFRTVGVASAHLVGFGYLPMVWLPDTATLPRVVPCLAAAAHSPQPGPPRAVSFDAGFTLIEPLRGSEEMIADQLLRAGFVSSRREIHSAFAAAGHLLARPDLWWAGEAAAAAKLTLFYETVLAELAAPPRIATPVLDAYTSPANWKVRSGAIDLLAAIRATGRKVGVLSNWQASLGEVLRATGLDRHVDAVVVSTTAGVAKPSAMAFHAVAEALSIPVGHLVHVGDDPVDDVGGALRAGARAILADGPLSELIGLLTCSA
jgi:HAD superfamily hydrolase (TIGR01509 family)